MDAPNVEACVESGSASYAAALAEMTVQSAGCQEPATVLQACLSTACRESADIVVRHDALSPLLARDVRAYLEGLPSDSWGLTETKDQPQHRAHLVEMRFHQLKTFEKLQRSKKHQILNFIGERSMDACEEQACNIINKRIHEALAGALALKTSERMLVSFSKYEEGSHLASHTDQVSGSSRYKRLLAFVWHLSIDWLESDGGLFVDEEAEGGHRHYVPTFNSLVTFAVPRRHRVTQVAAARSGREARFAVYGWVVEARIERMSTLTEFKSLVVNTQSQPVVLLLTCESTDTTTKEVLACFSGLPLEASGKRKLGECCVFAITSSLEVYDALNVRRQDHLAVAVFAEASNIEKEDAGPERDLGAMIGGCQICSDLAVLQSHTELLRFINDARVVIDCL